MLYQNIHIDKYDWEVHAFYDTTDKDSEIIMDCLYDLGCRGDVLKRAFQNLSSGNMNTGLTFSKNNRSCIVLGRTTDKANFANTLVHEIFHCAVHIADEYGINTRGEEIAYIAGDMGAEMLPYASKFLCECCKTKNYRNYGKYRNDI